jgi:hypothetical protein
VRIVGVSTVRNEADVIEAFVRHHCRFVDRLVVVCHFSQDSTAATLQALVKEGLPLEVVEESHPIHDQAFFTTRHAKRAVAAGADFVVALDGDEFLIAADGGDPRAALEALPADRVSLVRWRTYVPRPDDHDEEPNVLRRIRHRPSEEGHPLGKVIVPAALMRPDVQITIGNHEVHDRKRRIRLSAAPAHGLALAHYPYRSNAQIRAKVLGGWPSHVANPERGEGQSEHWHKLFDQALDPAGFGVEELRELALGYGFARSTELVDDPVEAPFELQHPVARIDPVRVLGETAVGLAEALRPFAGPKPPFAWRVYAGVRRRIRAQLSR